MMFRIQLLIDLPFKYLNTELSTVFYLHSKTNFLNNKGHRKFHVYPLKVVHCALNKYYRDGPAVFYVPYF